MRLTTPNLLEGLKLAYFFCFNRAPTIEDGEERANRIEALYKKSFATYSDIDGKKIIRLPYGGLNVIE